MIWISAILPYYILLPFISSSSSFSLSQGVQSQIVSNALKEIITIIRENPDHFILFLHSQNSILKRDLDDNIVSLENLQVLLCCSSAALLRTKLDLDWSFKFTQPFHLIFASYELYYQTNYIFQNMFDYLVRIYTVTILLGYQQQVLQPTFTLSTWQIYFPEMTLLLELRDQATIAFSVNCAQYCDLKKHGNIPWSKNNLGTYLTNPPQQHRVLFRSGNQRQINAHHFSMRSDYYKDSNFGRDRYACGRLLPRSKLMLFCDYYLMSLIYMSGVHNISFNILKRKSGFFFAYESQDIEAYVDSPSMYTFIHRDSFYMSRHLNDFLLYCEIDYIIHSNFDPALWTCAFTKESWTLIIVSVLIFAITFVKCNYTASSSVIGPAGGRELFRMLSTVVRQPPSETGRLKIVFLGINFVAFLLTSLYENSITSTVTIRTPTPSYDRIDELLHNGYKIMWFPNGTNLNSDPEYFYSSSFLQKRVKISVKDAFVKLPGTAFHATLKKYLTRGLAFVLSSVHRNSQLPLLKSYVPFRNKVKVGDCTTVKEPLDTYFTYWKMYTINRPWLWESIERIHQSGLRDKIKEWQDWALNLDGNLLQHSEDKISKPFFEAEVIKIDKLPPPLIAFAFGIAAALLAFGCEYGVFNVPRFDKKILRVFRISKGPVRRSNFIMVRSINFIVHCRNRSNST